MKDHWTYKLFVENPELYLPALEEREARADTETEALVGLLQAHGMPAGARVLDVGCGIGRHSIRLALRGYSVVGVDLSPLFVARARERAAESGLDATFIEGDAHNIAELVGEHGPFDAVVSMFTSNGYQGRTGDVSLFRQLRELANPDAVLVVLTSNRDWLVHNLTPDLDDTMGGNRIVMRQSFDLATSTFHNRWTFLKPDSDEVLLVLNVDVRAYSLHEMNDMMAETGWQFAAGRGAGTGFELHELTAEHSNMWVVGKAV